MDSEEAVTEFVSMLRLGTSALREVISRDAALSPDIEEDINKLLYLTDSIDEIADSIRRKTQSIRRGIANR